MFIMKSSILSTFFLILGWNSIDASPVGAPGAACSTMVPSHGVPWQERDCPFEILLDTTVIRSDEMLTIRLAVKDGLNETDPAMAGFKGFMVMAFDASGVNIEPIGMFHIPATTDVQTMNCPSSNGNINSQVGVTHTSNSLKKSIEVMWMPPNNYVGPIIIMTTFVQEKVIFWVKETSHHVDVLPVLETTTSASTTAAAATSTQSSTQSSTQASTQTSTDGPGTGSRLSYSTTQWIVLSSLVILSYYTDYIF